MIYIAKYSHLIKESGWILLGQVSAIAGALVGVRVLTDLMSTESYGQLALGMTVVALVNQVFHGPLLNSALRIFSTTENTGQSNIFLFCLRKLVIQSCVIITGIALFFGTVFWFKSGAINFLYVSLTIASLAILLGLNSIFSALHNAVRQRSIVALHQGIAAWLKVFTAAVLMSLFVPSSLFGLLGYSIAMLFVVLSQYRCFLCRFGSQFTSLRAQVAEVTAVQKAILQYAWPFASWGIFLWAQQASDRWALEVFCSTEEVGLYAVLHQVGFYPFSLGTGILFQLIAPILFQKVKDASDRNNLQLTLNLNTQIMRLVGVISVSAAVAGLLLHEHIFYFLAAPEFRDISYLLPWTMFAGGFFAIGQILSINQMSALQSRELILPRVITSVIGILLNFVGAYLMGVQGVVLANLVFSILYFTWIFHLSAKLSIKLNSKKALES